MALRNYMYYKHQDDLKDRIAPGVDRSSLNSTQTISPHTLPAQTVTPNTTPFISCRRKKLTPTQLRKLNDLKIQEAEKEKSSEMPKVTAAPMSSSSSEGSEDGSASMKAESEDKQL
ncbi:hypothetical protein WICPIJ_007652 [Wickerhamomyces pijperi]|uniref:Uncharacterized protein n=1 Tax=Wickerhamomyces pijperi TaxID=599730 RepID=A0A9P8PZU5_WICPI|nr:hypothetical protein WICPIJ_007652 [Wickerhamomyces pijperi]